MNQLQRFLHDPLVLLPQKAQGPGVGIAAGADHIVAGHELRVDALGHQYGHAPGNVFLAAPLHGGAVQQHRAGDLGELAHDGFQNGGLAGAVGANQGHDLPPLDLEAHIPDEGLPVIAYGKLFRFQKSAHSLAPFLWSII